MWKRRRRKGKEGKGSEERGKEGRGEERISSKIKCKQLVFISLKLHRRKSN